MKRKDLKIGSKFGKLTVLKNIYEGGNGGAKVKVQCECGKKYITAKSNIKSGNTTQCFNCGQKIKSQKRRKGIKELSGYYFGRLKKNAEIRNIKFDLAIKDLYALFIKQNKKCALTGLPLILDNYKRCYGTASLDRIDSFKGYTINNVQWIHKELNRLKNKYSIEELIYWIDLIKNNNKSSEKD